MSESTLPRPYTAAEIDKLLALCFKTRYIARNRLSILLSCEAGLTVTEMAELTRRDVMDNGTIGHSVVVRGKEARIVPMSPRLRVAVRAMFDALRCGIDQPLLLPERANREGVQKFRPGSIANFLYELFDKAGLVGVSSRSGRLTFIKAMIAKSHTGHDTGLPITETLAITGYHGAGQNTLFAQAETKMLKDANLLGAARPAIHTLAAPGAAAGVVARPASVARTPVPAAPRQSSFCFDETPALRKTA